MIVLIEGPDGAGKTTLANAFVSKGFKYIHLSKVDNVNEFYTDLISKLQKETQNVVIDRGVFSNIIYSMVFGGEIVEPHLARQFIQLCDHIIVCLPTDKDKYFNNFEILKSKREEQYNNMSKVYEYYELLYTLTNIECFFYRTFDEQEIDANVFVSFLV